MKNASGAKNRIHFLDEMRGLAVFCMLFYHAFYIIGEFFGVEQATDLFYFFMPIQPFFAGIFIFICGISCSLSRNNLKRGVILLGIALGMTLVTAVIMPMLGFVDCEIYFGILHFLSVCILLYTLFSKCVKAISPLAGLLVCAVFYIFTAGIGNGYLGFGEALRIDLPASLYTSDVLVPLGIYSPAFYSADYFPIFPDIFIFLAGAFTGVYSAKKGFPEKLYVRRAPFFGFLGKKTLIIYIVHMPLIYGAAYGFDFIINLFK